MYIINLEQKCQCCYCSCCCDIVAKSLQPPQNLHRPLKTFTCVSLRYKKNIVGVQVGIVVVVCGKICGKMCGR